MIDSYDSFVYNLARYFEELGHATSVVRNDALTATQALALQPSSWRHLQRLGLVYSRADRLDEAVLSFDRACKLGERQEACANHAVTLQRSQLLPRAVLGCLPLPAFRTSYCTPLGKVTTPSRLALSTAKSSL